MLHEEEKGNQRHFNTTQEQVYIMFINFNTTQEQVYIMFIIVPRKL